MINTLCKLAFTLAGAPIMYLYLNGTTEATFIAVLHASLLPLIAAGYDKHLRTK